MNEDNNPIQEMGVKTEEANNETTQNVEQKKVNNMALLSFIFSLIGLIVAGLPCGMVALITGIMGIAKFDSEKDKCKWMAIVGIVVGIFDIVSVMVSTFIRASKLL